MTTKEKNKIIQDILEGFDFEKVHSIMEYINWGQIFDNGKTHIPSVDELKKTARKVLGLALKHDGDDFWWAGTGGLYATIDKKRGVSLIFIPTKIRVNPEHKNASIT